MINDQTYIKSRSYYEPSHRVITLVQSVMPTLLNEGGTRNLIALAVVGSASRGEETWRGGKLIGDIDLAAVIRSPVPWAQSRFYCAARDLGEGIDLGCFPVYSLRRYRTLEFYEARQTAFVFWGNLNVFDIVRIDKASDIPKWEGLRLLLNRVMDCIKARAYLQPTWYAAVKSYLALGEADLIFQGNYLPSYRHRYEQLEKNGGILGSRELFELFHWATQQKLGNEDSGEHLEELNYEKWLLYGLTLLLSRYLGDDISAYNGLELIKKRIVHPLHRAAYLIHHLREPQLWVKAIQSDPIFSIWTCAIQILTNDIDIMDSGLRTLVRDWEETYQPLPT